MTLVASNGVDAPIAPLLIDLCEDEDEDSAVFAQQLNMLFDDDVELVSETRHAVQQPASARPSVSLGADRSAPNRDAGTRRAAIVIDGDEDGDEGDTDAQIASRLQAQMDAEEAAEADRRMRAEDADAELARRVQQDLGRDIAASSSAAGASDGAGDALCAANDVLRAQRNRIRHWLQLNALSLHVRDVWSNPAAMPGGALYERFAAAYARAKDKSVRLVFHGTREENISQICTHGLDPSRRGVNGQALGAGEYFAERPDISLPYCVGANRMLVFAVLMDHQGLTRRQSGIVVINRTEHQLPMFVITFEPKDLTASLAGLAPALAARLSNSNTASPYHRAMLNHLQTLLAARNRSASRPTQEREQRQLAAEAEAAGRRRGNGFASADAARLRMYERASKLPRSFARLCRQVTRIAVEADSAMPNCDATHCLINKYTSAKGLLWHRDIYANDGDGDKPIVNLSVGASCVFGVVDDRSGRTHRVTLRSGDALLFGGACRFAKHAVLDVLLDEAPEWMARDAPYRLSFTFREAHSVLGKEAFYRTFEVKRRWFKETQSAWRPGDPLVPDPV